MEFPNIPGYTIEKELGHGGMATVYLAVQENLKRKVAIKLLEPSLLKDKKFERRFIKEAETSANLSHPNIITVFDVGKSGNYLYLSMERLSDSLKDRLKKQKTIEKDQAVNIVIQIASALNYAHSKKIIHRDIKSDNIMFRNDGTPVLVDFGIAKAIDASSGLTKTGFFVGTPLYMSPEQIKGEDLDGRSDIYSLGVLFFEMLTGSVPYKAKETVALAMKHVQEPVPELKDSLQPSALSQKQKIGVRSQKSEENREISLSSEEIDRFQDIINRMMAKDPGDRPRTGMEVVELVSAHSSQPSAFSQEQKQEVRIQKTGEEKKSSGSGTSSPSGGRDASADTIEEITGPILKKSGKKKKLIIIGLTLTLLILIILTVLIVFKVDKKVINEKEFWANMRTENRISSYRKYLEKFPEGKYASQARWWINTLNAIEESRKKKK